MKIFPDPHRQKDIKFIFAKSLSYTVRMHIILGCLAAGLLIQLFLNFWAGLALLSIGTVLSLINGYSSSPRVLSEEKWAQVTPDEFNKVKSKQKELERWDMDCFDITNPLGAVVIILLALFCLTLWGYLNVFAQKEQLAFYWAIDCAVLFLPHWITGVRSFLRKDKLIIKINLLEQIMEFFSAPSDIQVLPMLSTAETKGKGRMPMDARLLVRFLNAPSYFLGMQVQISINSIEGKDFPYLYCVLIVKEGAGLFLRAHEAIQQCRSESPRLTLEEMKSDGVDVLVIRQFTTRTSGYYTNSAAARNISYSALALCRQILGKIPLQDKEG